MAEKLFESGKKILETEVLFLQFLQSVRQFQKGMKNEIKYLNKGEIIMHKTGMHLKNFQVTLKEIMW